MLYLRGGPGNIFMQSKQDISEKHKTARCSVCSMFVNIQIVNCKKIYTYAVHSNVCHSLLILIAAKSHFTSVYCHISWTTDNRVVVQILFYIAHYLKKQKLIIYRGKKTLAQCVETNHFCQVLFSGINLSCFL